MRVTLPDGNRLELEDGATGADAARAIGEEWDRNPFVRLWRGLDEESDDRCRVGDEEAQLVLLASDYDGGHKAWVRFAETGRDDIVPGSAVERY